MLGWLKLSNVDPWRHPKTQDGVNLEQPDLALMLDLLQAKVWTLQSSLQPQSFQNDLFVLAWASQDVKRSFSRSQICVSHAQCVDTDPPLSRSNEWGDWPGVCHLHLFFSPFNPCICKTYKFLLKKPTLLWLQRMLQHPKTVGGKESGWSQVQPQTSKGKSLQNHGHYEKDLESYSK